MAHQEQAIGVQGVDLAQRSEEEQRAFYEAALERALQAQARAGVVERLIDLAGVRIRLLFAGRTVEAEFMGALAHLEAGAGPADAVFHIFDTQSTGVAMVPPPCPQSAFTDRGDIWGFSSRAVRSAFHWSEFSLSLYDADARVGIYWIETTHNLPYWVRSSPLRTLFHWLMEDCGRQLVHAAAIGTADGGALITGKGGVGKSSSALAGLVAGMSYIGDDYLVVGFDPEPTAYSLYSTAKLEPHQVDRFPELLPLMEGERPAPGEKAVIHLFPARRDQIVARLPLTRVLTPRFGEGEVTTFEPISASELHRAAAFTTMCQLPHAGVRTHDFIRRLVESTDRRRIVLGRDVRRVPEAIAALLAEAPAPAPAQAAVAPALARPLVSVVVPVFNGARFLGEAIASLLAQDYPALEIIVVDDGSEDALEEAVAALPVEVRFFRQRNLGPAAARNRGIREASGELLAFLDVDDLWPADNLSMLVTVMDRRPACDVVLGKGQLAQIDPDAPGGLQFLGNPEESFRYYIGSALYRPRAFAAVGLFDEEMRFAEDGDWFERAREKGIDIEALDQMTLIVRRHEDNMTRGKSAVELNVLRMFKKALDRRRADAAQAGGGAAPSG